MTPTGLVTARHRCTARYKEALRVLGKSVILFKISRTLRLRSSVCAPPPRVTKSHVRKAFAVSPVDCSRRRAEESEASFSTLMAPIAMPKRRERSRYASLRGTS